MASAFSLYFDLVNLAEEDSRVQTLRQQNRENAPGHDSIEEALSQLKQNGVSAAQMQALLQRLSIELVLTAHPTETKRRTILAKTQRISEILRNLNRTDLLPVEVEAYRQALHIEISAFWLSDRTRTARPEVTDEVRTGLYTIDSIFWEALPRIYADMDAALAKHYPGLTVEHPWLRLASWIGGDRDGNPNLTTSIHRRNPAIASGSRRGKTPRLPARSRPPVEPQQRACPAAEISPGLVRAPPPPARARGLPGKTLCP